MNNIDQLITRFANAHIGIISQGLISNQCRSVVKFFVYQHKPIKDIITADIVSWIAFLIVTGNKERTIQSC
jgi:hypothetical protein